MNEQRDFEDERIAYSPSWVAQLTYVNCIDAGLTSMPAYEYLDAQLGAVSVNEGFTYVEFSKAQLLKLLPKLMRVSLPDHLCVEAWTCEPDAMGRDEFTVYFRSGIRLLLPQTVRIASGEYIDLYPLYSVNTEPDDAIWERCAPSHYLRKVPHTVVSVCGSYAFDVELPEAAYALCTHTGAPSRRNGYLRMFMPEHAIYHFRHVLQRAIAAREDAEMPAYEFSMRPDEGCFMIYFKEPESDAKSHFLSRSAHMLEDGTILNGYLLDDILGVVERNK
jgi:hypothetical protein